MKLLRLTMLHSNKVKQNWLIILSIIAAVVMIGSSLRYRSSLLSCGTSISDGFDVESVLPREASNSSSGQNISAATLAKYDGQNCEPCYVAIDESVYEIEQGRLWQDGQHTTSGGKAMCGKDLTEALKQSPHGRSKLEGLPKVGVYKP